MDGSVRQPADEGKKGPLEALFEPPPRRPRSLRRDRMADRRAAAAAHHCPRPCVWHGSRWSAARSTAWAVVQTFGTKCNGRYTVHMTLEPSDHCLRAPRDARDASSCSPAMSFDSLVRRSITIDDLRMCRACSVAGVPRSAYGT